MMSVKILAPLAAAAALAGAVAFAPIAGASPDPLLPYGPDPQVPTSIGIHVDNQDETNTTNGHVDLPF
ncbi:hypothetical protein [Mycolicibacterium sediminis]|uniref:Uncharacterized protein n=1 Tax=Mycolicibacterium sediminis TaxID=1286180 RepID=A0A7I7QMK0_9MYCO|nr:hypothetical protein [Mycolicibacterium sediminis]BBY27096.1 hypothetical protein MSEDJ_11920 [Mycolicibacterium sediminis]